MNSRYHVPLFLIVMLCILGFNEAKLVLFNPLLFMLTVIFGGIGALIYFLDLGGVAQKFASIVMSTSFASIHAWMDERKKNGESAHQKGGSTDSK